MNWSAFTTAQLRAHADHLQDTAGGQLGELQSVQNELYRRGVALDKALPYVPVKDTYSQEVVDFENERGWKYN